MIDDASHLLGPSRASFDVLFPRLRPGGLYLLEDWSWAHPRWKTSVLRPKIAEEPPLSALVYALILATSFTPGVVRSVSVHRGWALVERGPDAVDDFRLDAAFDDEARGLVDQLARAPEVPQ